MAVMRLEFLSEVLGEMTNVAVAVPMTEKGKRLVEKGGKFKVIYLLHGGGGDCSSYLKDTSIERFSTEGNFAVVMPEVRRSYYCDMVYGLPFFTYLSEELPKVVESIFPISSARQDRFLMGNSMGAHGAVKWALRRPDFCSAAAGMSGISGLEDLGFLKRFDEDSPEFAPFRAAFGSREEYFNGENDVKFLAKRAAESGCELPRLFSCCGTEDSAYEGCRKFYEYAQELGLPLTFEEGPGEHTLDFWEKWMPYIIGWFGLREVS